MLRFFCVHKFCIAHVYGTLSVIANNLLTQSYRIMGARHLPHNKFVGITRVLEGNRGEQDRVYAERRRCAEVGDSWALIGGDFFFLKKKKPRTKWKEVCGC